ncbi:MAG: DUF6563 family protein [Bacteroidota bacterium]|nr:DUF6563 family protein [Bacteroidota bacterium]
MKYLIITCSFISLLTVAQEIYKGESIFYEKLKDYKENKVSYKCEVTICLRSTTDIFKNFGNDYRVVPKKASKKQYLREECLLMQINDTLYINGFKLNQLQAYTKILFKGEYLFFQAAATKNDIENINFALSLAGAPIVAGVIESIYALKRYNFILDTKNGKFRILTINDLINIVSKYPKLVELINSNPNWENPNEIVKILTLYEKLNN